MKVVCADSMGFGGLFFLIGQDSILIVLHQMYHLSMGSFVMLPNCLKYCLSSPGNFMALEWPVVAGCVWPLCINTFNNMQSVSPCLYTTYMCSLV